MSGGESSGVPGPRGRWPILGPAVLLYGAIVTAAVLVITGLHDSPIRDVVAAWAFVLVTYWLAHVYVHTTESQFEGDHRNFVLRAA